MKRIGLYSSMYYLYIGIAIMALMVTAGCYDNNQNKKKTMAGLTAAQVLSRYSSSGGASAGVGDTIADYRVAKESVLRSIPQTAIDAAKNNLKYIIFTHPMEAG